ncbi:uncharacterized protein EDB91DRAFT_1253956 [Suillus paluster]|uniref:uncharacterized protein n=1 Tax=Suillus paluster TaxID=48578 RepID=UPI001B87B337|nr:uncharacterized protein EDB91DRAFT_1253956 [Suillus paluster]KAG1727264.1 hypothetical protein EDB91DRAFT_1253956 [Suillus paluster]
MREVLALSFAAWVAVKHFRELQRQSAGSAIADCFTVLIKSHVLYFAAYTAVNLDFPSPNIVDSTSVGVQVYWGAYQTISFVQQFVLGPRLILSVRQYHAKLVAESDEGTAMTTIAFQERVHESTGGDVELQVIKNT